MNALDLLLTRRSVSARYLIEPGPSPEQIETILTAAIRVPDHGKLAPWRVQIIPKEARDAFTRIALAAYDAEVDEKDEGKREKLSGFADHAPLMLVVSTKLQRGHKIPEIANWLTGFPAYSPAVKRALGLAENESIVGFFFIGTPELPPSERPRPSVGDILTVWRG